eukprot:scaffold30769_cov71-Phaeocystis_antarctica.AAC.9
MVSRVAGKDTLVKAIEPRKARLPIAVSPAGRVSSRRKMHPLKAPRPMVAMVGGSVTFARGVPLKAHIPMVVRLAGKVSSVREVPSKARSPMVVRPAGRVSGEVRKMHPRKTPAGIATRSSGRQKYGQRTRALRIRPAPGTMERCTAVRNAARSSLCAAAWHSVEAAANLARLRASSSSATSVISSGGRDANV